MGMGRWDHKSLRLDDHISITYLTTISFFIRKVKKFGPTKESSSRGLGCDSVVECSPKSGMG